jgi:hypothetical protein
MHMRKFFLTAFVLAASLAFATSGLALEKTAARMTDDTRPGDWNAGTTCVVAYYNTCTGWVWVWSGWGPSDVIGACFENCCSPNVGILAASWTYVWTAAPSGYGFTGTIAVSSANSQCCPATQLASQTFLPISGWNSYLWNTNIGTGSSFVVSVTHGTTSGSPLAYASDHPAAGPTGPAACGTCFPDTRVEHSFYYGTPGAPLCPGSSLNDGSLCGAEWLWDAEVVCMVSVEESSFGAIKNLYR